jgi:hypothetical protein
MIMTEVVQRHLGSAGPEPVDVSEMSVRSPDDRDE